MWLRYLTAALVLSAFAPLAQALPETSPETSTATLDPVYASLAGAMFNQFDLDVVARNLSRDTTDAAIRNDPAVQQLVARKPQIRVKIVEAIIPFERQFLDRNVTLQRERAVTIFAARLTPAEARTCLNMYRSPLGRKTFQSIGTNLRMTNTANEAVAGRGSLSGEAFDRDMNQTMGRTANQIVPRLTPAELRQLRIFVATPAFRKFNTAMMQFQSSAAASVESDMTQLATPEERTAMREAYQKVVRDGLSEP